MCFPFSPSKITYKVVNVQHWRWKQIWTSEPSCDIQTLNWICHAISQFFHNARQHDITAWPYVRLLVALVACPGWNTIFNPWADVRWGSGTPATMSAVFKQQWMNEPPTLTSISTCRVVCFHFREHSLGNLPDASNKKYNWSMLNIQYTKYDWYLESTGKHKEEAEFGHLGFLSTGSAVVYIS